MENQLVESNTFKKAARQDRYQGHDYYNLEGLLTEEQKIAQMATREWVKKEVSPIIEDAYERAVYPKHLLKGLGELGALGPSLPAEYGCAGADEVTYGLMMMELERGDSGIRSAASVQGSLVMYPIYKYGSEEHRQKYLPKLASGEMIGCFGLTEPNSGSDPGSMTTNIKDDGVPLPDFDVRTDIDLSSLDFSVKTISTIISNLDPTKATGPDGIPVVLLQKCSPELSPVLANLYKKCFAESCFPSCWKRPSVIPVLKNSGGRSNPSNYRPVSYL